jgi:hypothetical protein
MLANFNVDVRRMMDESLAFGDQGTPEMHSLQEAWENGDYARADQLARAELARTPPSPRRNWILAVGKGSLFSTKFAKGNWANLPEEHGCWYRWNAGSEHPGGNALSFATRQGFSQARRFRPDLGRAYEIRGEVKLPDGASSLTLNIGTPDEFNALYTWRYAQFELSTKDRAASHVRIVVDRKTSVEKEGPALGAVATFRLQRRKNQVSWWVNDELLVENYAIPADLRDGPCAFGFGVNTFGGQAPVTLEKLQARKLSEEG